MSVRRRSSGPFLSAAHQRAAAGGDVVRGKARWDLERQVRLAAGSLVVVGLAGGRFVSPKIRMLPGVIGTGDHLFTHPDGGFGGLSAADGPLSWTE